MKRFYSWKALYIACFLFIVSAAAGAAEFHVSSEPFLHEQLSLNENHTNDVVRLYSFAQVPDSAEIRRQIAAIWLTAPIEEVINAELTSYVDSKGNTFKVSGKYAHEMKDMYVVSIVPFITDYGVSDKNLVPQGTWMLYRNSNNGAPSFIKIYPRENPALAIYLRPPTDKAHTGKSFIDICLYNAYVRKDIAIGLNFQQLYTLSLADLRKLTQDIIPWSLFDPPWDYGSIERIANIVRTRTYQLVSLEGGCFDESGIPIYIKNGSPQTEIDITASLRIDQLRGEVLGGVDSAGFAKWVVDGIIKPVSGKGTFLQSLKRSTDIPSTHFTEPFLQSKSIFFNLNWIRNLAAAALSSNLKRSVYPQNSGIDVICCPFALTNTVPAFVSENEVDIPAFSGYEKHAGYQSVYLSALLYYLASVEPGHFYLGCVNHVEKTSGLRIYSDIAVFFPYFDVWGGFHLDVFEKGIRIPISDFIKRNNDTYTALVRIRAPEAGLFNP